MKKLLIGCVLGVATSISACSRDIMEDEQYVHVKKDQVYCELKKKEKQYARGGHMYYQLTSVCSYIKRDIEQPEKDEVKKHS